MLIIRLDFLKISLEKLNKNYKIFKIITILPYLLFS